MPTDKPELKIIDKHELEEQRKKTWEYVQHAENTFHGRFTFFLAANILLFVIGYLRNFQDDKILCIVSFLGAILTYLWIQTNASVAMKTYVLHGILSNICSVYKAYLSVPRKDPLTMDSSKLFDGFYLNQFLDENYPIKSVIPLGSLIPLYKKCSKKELFKSEKCLLKKLKEFFKIIVSSSYVFPVLVPGIIFYLWFVCFMISCFR